MRKAESREHTVAAAVRLQTTEPCRKIDRSSVITILAKYFVHGPEWYVMYDLGEKDGRWVLQPYPSPHLEDRDRSPELHVTTINSGVAEKI
jgi:hypothetical protein